MSDFYKIPFSFKDLLNQENHRLHSGMAQSIHEHISLIITTRLGDFRYDPQYGCEIWEVDFIVPSNLNAWKDQIKRSLEEAILKHEKRIDSISRFVVKVETNNTYSQLTRINQRLEIELSGNITGTNKLFHYSEVLFFSPVSVV